MGKYAQLVMGPAGSGKSTYINAIRIHCENIKRIVHCINLDPAAEVFNYPVTIDIRNLINIDDVMEELSFGPNGSLIFAMEYLLENIDWFQEEIGDYDSDYLLIDCPGQIELYSHIKIMKNLIEYLKQWGYYVCGVFLLDSQFMIEPSKFMAGTLQCLSSMIRLEIPQINIISKMDLLGKKMKSKKLEKFFYPDVSSLINDLHKDTPQKFYKLNEAIGTLINDYNMVNFLPLNIKDEDNISYILSQIDNAIQYGEDEDIPPPKDEIEDII